MTRALLWASVTTSITLHAIAGPSPSAAPPSSSTSTVRLPPLPSTSAARPSAPVPNASSTAPLHARPAASTSPISSAAPRVAMALGKAPPTPKPAPKVAAPNKPAPTPAPKVAKGWAPAPYVAMVARWHEAAPSIRRDERGRPQLVLAAINRAERTELVALSDQGGFDPLNAEKAAHALRGAEGLSHPIDPRLLDLLLDLALHFDVAELRFLSGYRPHHGAPPRASDPPHAHPFRGSNHGCGRAIDLVVPGHSDEEVAKYARTLGFVGVGIYPTSGFVHLDVRERSFFWFDRSGPGRPNRTVRFLAGEAAQTDRHAHELGLLPAPDPSILSVDAAVAARLKAAKTLPLPPSTEMPEEMADDDNEDEP